METDIRGAVEAGLQSFLVLSGSTRLENVGPSAAGRFALCAGDFGLKMGEVE